MRAGPTTSKHAVLRRSCVECSHALAGLQDYSRCGVQSLQHRACSWWRHQPHNEHSSCARLGWFFRSRDRGFLSVASRWLMTVAAHLLPPVCCSESIWSQSGHLVFVSLTRMHEPPTRPRERRLGARLVSFLIAACARRSLASEGRTGPVTARTLPLRSSITKLTF
jgi:hypothetical protein